MLLGMPPFLKPHVNVGYAVHQIVISFLDTCYTNYSHILVILYIRFLVDGTPIRQYKNLEATNGIPYPKNQPMWLYSSLWNAEEWATRGGLVRTDWSKAPFIASYRNFNAQTSKNPTANSWLTQSLDNVGLTRMKWVQKNYMIYNYCTDTKRFPQGFPHECTLN